MAENDVKEWIPSTTGDYTGGKVTFTVGSKDITFENAFNGGEHSFTAGDSIYIPTEGRWLLLNEITSTTKGTLLYPCPESCAGTFDLRIRQLSRNARQAGLATMILRNLNTGNLAGIASVKLKTGQILVASQTEGSFYAIELNADNIGETETHKIMTNDERNKIANLDKTISTVDGKIANLDSKFVPKSGGTVDGDLKVNGAFSIGDSTNVLPDGNITGSAWSNGNLSKHINNCMNTATNNAMNGCVTDTRVSGWANVKTGPNGYVTLPSGYFANAINGGGYDPTFIAGVQPQVLIKKIGWVPIGRW